MMLRAISVVPPPSAADCDDSGAPCERQYCVELQMMDLGVHDTNDRTRRRGKRAVENTVIHVVDELLPHRAVHKRPARPLARTLVVGLARFFQHLDVVDWHVGLALCANATGELGAAADRAPLVVELP